MLAAEFEGLRIDLCSQFSGGLFRFVVNESFFLATGLLPAGFRLPIPACCLFLIRDFWILEEYCFFLDEVLKGGRCLVNVSRFFLEEGGNEVI